MKYYDIICIGTGASAMYFGYKASKLADSTGKKLRILFLSKDTHVGGRISSIPIKDNPEYKAEICATRFYRNQELLFNTTQELNSQLITIGENSIPIVTPTHPEIIRELLEDYPKDSPDNKYTEISFPTAISLSSDAGNVDRFAYEIGYYHFTQNINLDSFYNDFETSGLREYRFVNGFQSFIDQMYNKTKEKYRVIGNYLVKSIEYDKHQKLYNINDEYICKKVIYTGTMYDFASIFTTDKSLLQTRQLQRKYTIPLVGFKCYLYFDKPFWGDLLYKYTGHPLLNQLIFYSKNTILIYTTGETSNRLINMLPIEVRRHHSTEYGSPKWITLETEYQSSSPFTTLVDYIKKEMVGILRSALPKYDSPIPTEEQLDSISSILIQYRPQIAAEPIPIDDNIRDAVFKRIQSHKNFYYLTGT